MDQQQNLSGSQFEYPVYTQSLLNYMVQNNNNNEAINNPDIEHQKERQNLKKEFQLDSTELEAQFTFLQKLEEQKNQVEEKNQNQIQNSKLLQIIPEETFQSQQKIIIPQVCSLSITNPITVTIASFIKGTVDYSQYRLLQDGKLFQCTDVSYFLWEDNQIFIFSDNQLIKFIPVTQNQMEYRTKLNFNQFLQSDKNTKIYYLYEPVLGKKLIMVYVSKYCFLFDIIKNGIVGSLEFKFPKTSAIVWTDQQYLFFCSGKENPEICEYFPLNKIFQLGYEIKGKVMNVKFKSWTITKNSMQNAVVVESNNKKLIIGRKKERILIISNINFDQAKIKIDYFQQEKINSKASLTESNITKLDDGSFLFLEDNLNLCNPFQAQLLKI